MSSGKDILVNAATAAVSNKNTVVMSLAVVIFIIGVLMMHFNRTKDGEFTAGLIMVIIAFLALLVVNLLHRKK